MRGTEGGRERGRDRRAVWKEGEAAAVGYKREEEEARECSAGDGVKLY